MKNCFKDWSQSKVTYIAENTDLDQTALESLISVHKRIYYECEGRIEKFRPEDHRLSSQGLASDDKR